MVNTPEVLIGLRPSMRRAFFYGLLYAGAVVYGRFQTDLDPQFNPVWWGCFGILMGLLALVLLRRACTSYLITTEDIQTRTGILARKFAVVPLGRITNVNAEQSFLERLLGLVNLRIDCAGSDTTEILFRLITTGEAQEAARILRERMAGSQPKAQTATAA